MIRGAETQSQRGLTQRGLTAPHPDSKVRFVYNQPKENI